jgi:multidrug efflux system membrane fusion protein
LSPLNGRVGLRQVDQGNYVTPGDTNGIVVITQLQPISVLFTVPEDNLQAIAKRLQAGAVLPSTALDRTGVTKIADGLLQTFDSQIDPTTGTIKLRAQFQNDDRLLYPNQFVNVRLLLDTHKNVTTMSSSGIQRGAPGTFVYLINADSTVSVRVVKLGVTDGDRVEVLSGLAPGDRIVVDGADKLRDGAKIVIRSETNPTRTNSPAQTPAEPDKSGSGKRQRSEGGQKQDGGQKQ